MLEAWKKQLARLHEDLTGLEQAAECIESLMRGLTNRRSRYLFSFVARLFGHWAAIGARRLYKKGNPRYANVALQRLLDDVIEHPDVVLKHGDPKFLGPWIGPGVGSVILPAQVSQAAKRDRDYLDHKMAVVAEYADTIAHLQLVGDDLSGALKIKGSDVTAALKELRRQVSVYFNLLTGGHPPDLDRDRFVEGLEDEVDELLSERSS